MPPRRMTHPAIAQDLAERIAAGEYPVGSKLPTYRELAEMYSVSHATIQRALMLLRASGYVEGVSGVGVFVLRQT